MDLNKVHNVDVLEGLKQLEGESVDCVVTSPPYWALRDYGVEGQLGLEPTFQEYIEKLLHVFDEVKRVLKPSGTCWVNIGDTYSAGGGCGSGEYAKKHTQFGKVVGNIGQSKPHKVKDMPSKCLVGVPERFSIAMRDNGWILRNTIIWHKPNCMPSSARDRFTVDFEPIFFFVKSKKYFFDMPREAPTDLIWAARMEKNVLKETGIKSPDKNVQRFGTTTNTRYNNPLGRAGRTVWRVTTQPFAEAHFATFPEELVKKPLLAGCPEFVCKACGKPREKIYEKSVPKLESRKALNHYLVSKKSSYEQGMSFKKGGFSEWRDKKLQEGLMNPDLVRDIFVGWSDCGCGVGWKAGVVLDPFMGSGTVGVVARKNSRDFIGFELNKEYVEIANKRLKPYMEQTKLTEVTDGY